MPDPRLNSPSWKRFFYSPLFLLCACILLLFVAIGYARAYYKDYKVRQEIAALREEVRKLEKKKIESFEILKYVKSPDFVEEKARTELNLKKPDEHVMIVPVKEDGAGTAEDSSFEGQEPHSILRNPLRWWYYFSRKTPSGAMGAS